jgi:hypothetical protein
MVRIALALVIVSQLAVWIALESLGTPTNIVVMNPPVVTIVQPPPPPAITTPIKRTWHAPAAKLDARVEQLHASRTDATLLAAWNDDHAFVSRDGGKTFAHVLDAPGPLVDVGFDSAGNVLAIRGAMVGILDADGERWRTIPGISPGTRRNAEAVPITVAPRLIDGGPDIVVVAAGPDEQSYSWLVASSDGGATWRYRNLEAAYEADRVHGAQSSDGTIRIALPVFDCDYEGLVWFTWTRDGHFDRDQIDGGNAGYNVYGDRAVRGVGWGSAGWVHATDSTWHDINGAPDGAIAIDAPEPMLLANRAIYRIAHSSAEPLPFCVDGESPIVDAANRIWMIDKDGAPRLAKLGSCPSSD